MARTPNTPRKTPRKRTTSATPAVASTSAVSLNARIHRILNAATELKRYSVDTNIVVSSGALYYVNPFVGITQGVTISGRLGDKIKIEKIIVTGKYVPSSFVTTAVGAACRLTHMKVDDTTLASATLSSLGISNYVYAGFPSIGAINNHDHIILADKKFDFMHLPFDTVAGAGIGWNGHMALTKTYKNGHDIMFKSGTNTQVDTNYIIVMAFDNSSAAVTTGTVYLAYNVFYRDA